MSDDVHTYTLQAPHLQYSSSCELFLSAIEPVFDWVHIQGSRKFLVCAYWFLPLVKYRLHEPN